MPRGDGQPQLKTLKDTEIARRKRQAEALRSNLKKRKDQERAREGGVGASEPLTDAAESG